jgi:hypothetical protein
MTCTSASPVRLVLMSDTMALTRVIPSRIAMYSGQFGIIKQTISPLVIPCLRAQRAYCLERFANPS